MKTREYTLNCGQYVYMVDGKPTTAPADTIAFGFDEEYGVLHKHGSPELVRAWHAKTSKALRDAGMVGQLVVVEGRFPLDEVNRMLSNAGYPRRFYEKLRQGQIQPLPYGDGKVVDAQGEIQPLPHGLKRWFGDSKVVDEQGNPQVLYHGFRPQDGESDGAFGGEPALVSLENESSEPSQPVEGESPS